MKSRLHAHVGTLRQLEILLAVHDAHSISGGAKALHLTQPTVSIQLKKLAEAIGAPLYHVSGRKLHFTSEGLQLVKTAVEVLDSFSRLDMSLNDMRDLKTGTLRLSVVTTSKYFIPHLLGPFCELHPAIDVQLNIGNRSQTIESMKQGVDDFYVFSHLPADPDMQSIKLLDNPLVAIAHADHPLAKKRKVSLQQICKEPFLTREPGSGTRYAIEEFLGARKMAVSPKMTIESNEAIKHCVMSRLGISILSAHTLTYGGEAGLKRLTVQELPIHSQWFFVWNKSKRQTVIASAFLDYVKTHGRTMLHAELERNGITPVLEE